MTPIDQAQRDEVVYRPVSRMLVEAGAGTGKTTLMIDRAFEAIVHGKITMGRMVLITYMEKAAEEITERLALRLHKARESAEGPARRRIERALRDLPQARIGTIHGFCRQLLADWAVEAGVPIDFSVADAYQADRLWQDAFHQWLSNARTMKQILPIWQLGISVKTLKEWARIMTQWAHLPAAPHAPWPNLADAIMTPFEPAIHEAWERAQLAATPDDLGYVQARTLAHQFAVMRRMPMTEWGRMMSYWAPTLAAKGNKKNWTHPQWLVEQKQMVSALKEALEQVRGQMADAMLYEWTQLMQNSFLPFWRANHFNRGVLTFDDLLRETQRLLHEREDIAVAVAQTIDLLMVDEFQDTDPVQADMIQRLVESGDNVHLLLVGDPKQSIYRFRGADAETYARVRENVDSVVTIQQNFRSAHDIIQFVNAVFAVRFGDSHAPPYVPRFVPLVASREPDSLPRVIIDGGPVEGNSAWRRRHEAHLAADMVATAVRQQWVVRSQEGDRPITYQDIVLVMPNRTDLGVFREVFESRGIPLSRQTGRNFFGREEVRGFYNLLAALRDPDDGVHVVGWLTSPWVGLSAQAVAVHRQMAGDVRYDREPQTLGTSAAIWLSLMERWHKGFVTLHPEEIFQQALEATGFSKVLQARQDLGALANLAKLEDLCRHQGFEWGTVEFTRWLGSKVTDGAPEEEGEIASPEGAVQVSTVHQSKGLEWPMVITCNWSVRPKRPPAWLTDSQGDQVALGAKPLFSRHWQTLEREWTVREAAERDRLRYVALTRPRDYLVVLETFDPNATTSESFWTFDYPTAMRVADIADSVDELAGLKSANLPPAEGDEQGRPWLPWQNVQYERDEQKEPLHALRMVKIWTRQPQTRPAVLAHATTLQANVPLYYQGQGYLIDVWATHSDDFVTVLLFDHDENKEAMISRALHEAMIRARVVVYQVQREEGV